MLSRRQFLKTAGTAAALLPTGCFSLRPDPTGAWVNDVHSQLNRTWVSRIERPASVPELQRVIAGARGGPVSIAAGRHAMGGQQFASSSTLIDTNGLRRILDLDEANGIVSVESGVQWPELIEFLRDTRWSIRQKQTGADRLSIGGGLAANVHGRGLTMKPIIADVESFVLIDAEGEPVECSRTLNRELFSLVIGGYGLFGVIASVRLRLTPRRKLQRVAEEQSVGTLMRAFDSRIRDGFLYGDFQFSIDEQADTFLNRGVFSCYRPVPDDTPLPEKQAELAPEDWLRLLYLAHADKQQAYERYVGYYLSTSGQVYWSDEHQLSFYPDDYHQELDTLLASARATEMISELYVPRHRLADFMAAAAEELRRRRANVVYGTVRLIERDDESFLAWAKQSYACVIFNLHIEHSPEGEAHAADVFRALIDIALARDGSYFLTYHRWARRDQVEAAYPQFEAFLREKRHLDPRERFQSDWYRHYARMFG